MDLGDRMNQRFRRRTARSGSFAELTRQHVQHSLHNLCLQLRHVRLKGLRHGACDDRFNLDGLPLALFVVLFSHAEKPFFLVESRLALAPRECWL